ncbi:MAG: hypothetical protein NTW86_14230 [Candidatus Sumerlaeota bacterium]|nr:hypothetical protein [Candidatus Sumerlaeota bacterium]
MRRTVIGVLILLAIAVGAGGYAFLRWRGSHPASPQDLTALLPADTAVCLSLRGLNEIWDRFETLKVCAQLRDQVDWDALLLSQKEWSERQANRGEISGEVESALLRTFVRRWFGRNAVAAMFPIRGQSDPAFVVLADANVGFEENLAELVAKIHPGLTLEKARYRGVSLSRFLGDKPTKGLACCRFGGAIALSLRSDSPAPLEVLADRWADRATPRFAVAFSGLDSPQGFAAYMDAPRTFATLALWEHLKLDKARRRGNFEFLRSLLEPMGRATATIQLSESPLGLSAQLQLGEQDEARENSEKGAKGGKGERGVKTENNEKEPSRPSTPSISSTPSNSSTPSSPSTPRLLLPRLSPPRTLLCLDGRSDRMGDLVRRWTFGFPEGSEIRGEAEKWGQKVRDWFGVELEKDLIPLLQGEFGLAWTGLQPGLAFPMFHGVLVGQVSDPKAAADLLERAFAHYDRLRQSGSLLLPLERREGGPDGRPLYVLASPIPGPVEVGVVGDILAIGLQDGSLAALAEALASQRPDAGLGQSPEFVSVGFDSRASYAFLGFANFTQAVQSVDDVAKRSLLWGGKIRESLRGWQDILQALSLARAVRVSSTDGARVEIFIPLQ